MKRYRLFALSFLTIVLLSSLLVSVLPVYATVTIAPPDVPPQILEANAYSGCMEAGDLGILAEYSITYAALPSIIATNAYLVAFIQADNVTQLASVAPYTFVSSGYTTVAGNPAGCVWLYFTAAQVTAYSLSSTNVTSYGVWIIGSPLVSWSGPVPLTKGSLTSWVSSSVSTQLGIKVLNYANIFGTYWSLSMSQSSPTGTVLTTTGQQYFQTVIPGLLTMCPQIFSAGSVAPKKSNLNYSSFFGATLVNGTGTATDAPLTFVEGANTVNVTIPGTFTVTLSQGTSGNATSGTAAVSGSPLDMQAGTGTITVLGVGSFTVTLELSNTQTKLKKPLIGTVFDFTPLANKFDMPVSLVSGLAWFLVTIIICAFVYGGIKEPGAYEDKSGKVVMLIFDLCIIGGAVIGMLPLLVAIMMFIGFGALTGYVLFFRTSGA